MSFIQHNIHTGHGFIQHLEGDRFFDFFFLGGGGRCTKGGGTTGATGVTAPLKFSPPKHFQCTVV